MIKFTTTINFIDKKYMDSKYKSIINETNIVSFSRKKANKVFRDEDQKIIEKYLFSVVKMYIEKNYETSDKFLTAIKKIVRRLNLTMDDLDLQQLRLLEERVFSVDRHIKTLSTDLKVDKNENIHIKFVDASLFVKNKSWKIIKQSNLLISNIKVIFDGEEMRKFFWNKIKNEKLTNLGWEFSYQNKRYLITIHDNETLKNTVINFKSKINIMQ